MRLKCNPQKSLNLFGSHLKITNEYHAKYEAIATILDEVPALVDMVHKDLDRALDSTEQRDRRGRKHVFTAENVLRILVCQAIEGESLRGIVIRIDDSGFLRRFVRIDHGPMMDYTTLCKLKNSPPQQNLWVPSGSGNLPS
ncbi:MAG: transposase [Acidobacteriota bacterium]|nr:transposase [Acidobacteriota bacterium]MDQ7087262.1 transposase [Acidobacteriota bacterium]